jgi:hypothetical protein
VYNKFGELQSEICLARDDKIRVWKVL